MDWPILAVMVRYLPRPLAYLATRFAWDRFTAYITFELLLWFPVPPVALRLDASLNLELLVVLILILATFRCSRGNLIYWCTF